MLASTSTLPPTPSPKGSTATEREREVEEEEEVEGGIEGGDLDALPEAEILPPQVMLDELENVNVLGE